jgi:hypothetical protein
MPSGAAAGPHAASETGAVRPTAAIRSGRDLCRKGHEPQDGLDHPLSCTAGFRQPRPLATAPPRPGISLRPRIINGAAHPRSAGQPGQRCRTPAEPGDDGRRSALDGAGRVFDARATAVQRQGRLGTDSPVQEASRGARSRTSTPGRQSECDDGRTSYSTMTTEALARASGISFEAIRDGLTFEMDHDERVIVLGLRRRQAG